MDRTEYLNLCKKVSVLQPRVSEECLVEYNGVIYYPQAYQLSFDKGESIHTAILHDISANSIVNCSLDNVSLPSDTWVAKYFTKRKNAK